MTNLFHRIASFGRTGLLRCNRGATAIEYGLIVALIAIAIVGSVTVVANKTGNMWGNVSNAVNNN